MLFGKKVNIFVGYVQLYQKGLHPTNSKNIVNKNHPNLYSEKTRDHHRYFQSKKGKSLYVSKYVASLVTFCDKYFQLLFLHIIV